MTALGCGVSAVPLPVLENSPVKDKVWILPAPFTPEPFDLGMVCLKNRLETPVISAFWQIVEDEAVELERLGR
jgi:LysR family transcriptional regulator, positive regulator for ilvC